MSSVLVIFYRFMSHRDPEEAHQKKREEYGMFIIVHTSVMKTVPDKREHPF